jgi:hypothetical protein
MVPAQFGSWRFLFVSALRKKRLDVRFNVGAVYNTHVCGCDTAPSVDEVGDRECVDRKALRNSVVAHKYGLINFVGIDEGIDEAPGPGRPFQIFVDDVHRNPNHGKAFSGIGVVNFDE